MTQETCRKLEVYRVAHDLAVRVHAMTLRLPSFERFEEGSQIRRSSKRVAASIVEGHSLRKYKNLYLSYLYRALASADETQEHLDLLHETRSLEDRTEYRSLKEGYERLSKQLFRYIQAVVRGHTVPLSLSEDVLEAPLEEDPDALAALELRRRRPQSAIRNPQSKEARNG